MNEKVLGFYEKDCDKFEERLNFPAEITIDENKLVPVVSVEKIEEVIKDISNAIEFVSKQSDTTVSYSAGQRCVLLAFKDCLKEAVEEKE